MGRPAKPCFVGPIRPKKNEKGRTIGYQMTMVSGPVPVVLDYPGSFQAGEARKALIQGGAHGLKSEASVQAIAQMAHALTPSEKSDQEP